MIVCEITLPLAATSAEHAPKSSWEKRRVLQNAEKKKKVSYRIFTFHQWYRVTSGWIIPSVTNQCHLNAKKKKRRASHNSRHNAINSKHNQHQYLHFTYLQLRKARTGMISFANHFSTKLKRWNHKYMFNSLLWHTCLGANIYILQALSYIVMTSSLTHTSHK